MAQVASPPALGGNGSLHGGDNKAGVTGVPSGPTPLTPGAPDPTRPLVRSAVRRWKRLHEQHMMQRLAELRSLKKESMVQSREVAMKLARKIPIEALARDWLATEEATVEVRAYMVDKVLPTLILGVEKLLEEVHKRGYASTDKKVPHFNPINYLAQYLMRNNPRYFNYHEGSPYVRGLREVSEHLRKHLFSYSDNRLAKIKADVKRKREDRELKELYRLREKARRETCLSLQFDEWGVKDGRVELSLLQNALRSFVELAEQFPAELQEVAKFGHAIEDTDETGRTLSLKEFAQFLTMYIDTLPSDMFDQFMTHLSKCAAAYRASADREARRIILTNLFINCDHSGIGLLDRHRILNLFERFWDTASEELKETLRNPRRWPVVEVDEAEELLAEEAEKADQEKVGPTAEEMAQGGDSRSVGEVDAVDEQAAEGAEAPGETEEGEGDKEDKEEGAEGGEEKKDEEKEVNESKPLTPTMREGVTEKEKENVEEEKEKDEAAEEFDVDITGELPSKSALKASATDVLPPDTAATGRLSITFAEGTTFEREKTEFTAQSRSQSQMSAFDENSLNVSQFVQLTETFLGDLPTKTLFESLVQFIKDGYEETEEEKLLRLMKARRELLSAKRKYQVDQLFEKWDNDGSGYLDMAEVEEIMNKYKDGQEAEAIRKGKVEFKKRSKFQDSRLSKREFRTFVQLVVDEIPGADTYEYFVDFLTNSVERSYAERVRGEARKKWLGAIVSAAETSGASMEPVCRAVFQALYKDAEAHGGNKLISANIAMMEKNMGSPDRGDVLLRYVATTPEDTDFVLGKCLYRDMKGISFAAIDSGKPIHVPRVGNHGNIHFWNTTRKAEEREGSFIVVPLKDNKKRVFGVLGIDTMNDPHSKAIFITHEIQYFQGVAKAFSIAYHHVDVRKKLLRITESAISWIQRRSPHVCEITVFLVEPDKKADEYNLRKMMTTDKRGIPIQPLNPPRLARKDNLFRDYLFKCVDNSETITADAYGERHLAYPLRDAAGRAVAVIDISIGDVRKLPPHENKETQRMLRLLQQAHREITREYVEGERTQVLDAEKDEDTRMDIMFDRLMLMELRENVGKLDAQAYAELKSYYEPPKIINDILKAVCAIFYMQRVEAGEFSDWSTIKAHINAELSQKIAEYDPTLEDNVVDPAKIERFLKDVPHGEVAKHGSLPAEHMYNWVFVCLSLIEHTRKMRQNTDEVHAMNSETCACPTEEEILAAEAIRVAEVLDAAEAARAEEPKEEK